MSELTPAQKAAITRNKNAAKAAKATTELSDNAADDIGEVGDDSGLTNVFNKQKPFVKTRNITGSVTLTQNGCIFDCGGNPLSLIED